MDSDPKIEASSNSSSNRIHWYFLLSAQSEASAQRVVNRICKLFDFKSKTELKRHHQPERGFWFRAETTLSEKTLGEGIVATLRLADQIYHVWRTTLMEFDGPRWDYSGFASKDSGDLKPGISFVHFELTNYAGWLDPSEADKPKNEDLNESI